MYRTFKIYSAIEKSMYNAIVNWRIGKNVNSKVSPNYSKSCLTEKFFINKFLDDCNLLKKRSELVSKCRHQNKFILYNGK